MSKNIDRLLKVIYNNENILKSFEEKNKILLDEDLKNEHEIERINKEIEDIKLDIKKQEIKLKNLCDELNVDISKYKTEPCKNNLCKRNFCTYAHTSDELRSRPKNNKGRCIFYDKGFCKKGDDCEFKHENSGNSKDSNLGILINGFTDSNISIKNDNNKDTNEENYGTKIYSSNSENKSLKEYNVNPKDNSINNGICDKSENIKFKELHNNEINDFIDKLEKNFEEYISKIKKNIDKEFTGSKYKYGINIKIELNKIMSEIHLFKLNYQDIIENNI